MKEFPIIDISKEDIDNYEQMGTKSKFWYTDKNDETEYLFKSIHTEDQYQNKIIRHGENWAEKIACEIARALGMPHAEYDLAIHNEEHGIRSKNFIVTGDDLTFGNSLIEYVVKHKQLEQGQRAQTIPRVYAILKNIVINPPKGWKQTNGIQNAFDVFIGYVMFDTLISNQDRHNENWAMVTDQKANDTLAPSFDHAASLGRNETDEKRLIRLTTNDKGQKIETYINKCKTWFYKDNKRLKTISAFIHFAEMSPNAGLEWLERLNYIDTKTIQDILSAIPSQIMTKTAKEFSQAIIMENKLRLLETKASILKQKKLIEEQGKK